MEASHARPMTAYAALCAAAVVVLAQGVTTTSPGLAESIAQVGDPVHRIAQPLRISNAVATSAGDQISEFGAQIGASVAQSVAPLIAPAPPAKPAVADQRSTGDARAKRELVTHTATAKQTTGAQAGKGAKGGGGASAPSDGASRDVLQRSGVSTPGQRIEARSERRTDRVEASADRRADRGSANADRRADRRADRASAKADRDAAKAERRAARAKHRR